MNVLIIGNLGYVGIPLTKLLKRNKINTIGLDCNWFYLNSHSDFNRNNFPNVQIFDDVRNFKLSKLNYPIDAVIYLAAVSNDPMGKKYKNATNKINYEACIKIAKEAKKNNIKKFIFASSCSMYGKTEGNKPIKENNPLNPLTHYAKSKINSEKKLFNLSDKKFKVISLRFATAAGFSPNLRLDLVFNDFVANAILKKKIELLSAGTSWRPLIHVDDMSRAIYWSINYKMKNNFLAINVGSNKWNFRIIDLAKKISKIIGKNIAVKIKDKKAIDNRSYKVDFSLFNKLAKNYIPQKKFKSAVNELENYLKNKKNRLKNFRQMPEWSRMSQLDNLVKKNKINSELFWK